MASPFSLQKATEVMPLQAMPTVVLDGITTDELQLPQKAQLGMLLAGIRCPDDAHLPPRLRGRVLGIGTVGGQSQGSTPTISLALISLAHVDKLIEALRLARDEMLRLEREAGSGSVQ